MDKKISTLLTEIKSATSWSEVKIAEELGTSQPTVNRILNGQDDCKGSTLLSIRELHCRVCAGYFPSSATTPAATVTSDKLAGEAA